MCWWRSSWGGFQPPLLIGALSHSLDFFCLVLIIMRCKGKKCRKAPQSGYEGYCKSCFRLKFPSRHASKQERRRKECPCCGETKELHSSGVCRPCMRARSCESCSKVNVVVEASFCPTCELQREKLGATRQRLAMWCTDCFSTQQLASGKCRACFSHIVKCHHCNKQDVDLSKPFRCSESDCASVFYMCATCLPYFQGRENVQCKSCWHASGDLCMGCSGQKAQRNLNKFRFCKLCIEATFCAECCRPPPAGVLVPKCLACHRSSLWCEQHASQQERASGLCAVHVNKCHHCSKEDVDLSTTFRCTESNCTSVFNMCATCLPFFAERDNVQCKSCWHASGRMCILCSDDAQHNLDKFRRCRTCFAKLDAHLHRRLVCAESDAYLQSSFTDCSFRQGASF